MTRCANGSGGRNHSLARLTRLRRVLSWLVACILLVGCGAVSAGPAPSSNHPTTSQSTQPLGAIQADPTIAIEAAAQQCEAGARTTLSMGQCFVDEEIALRRLLAEDLVNLRALFTSDDAKATLDRAQVAWEGYVAADCTFAAQFYAGGSQAAVDQAGCRAHDTLERVRALQSYIVQACQGQAARIQCSGYQASAP